MIEGEQPVDEEPAEIGKLQVVEGAQGHWLEARRQLVSEIADGAAQEGKVRIVPSRRRRGKQTLENLEGPVAENRPPRLQVRAHRAPHLELDAISEAAHHQVGRPRRGFSWALSSHQNSGASHSFSIHSLQPPP